MEPENLGNAGALKTDKRTVSDFHVWNQKIDHL